MLMNYIAYFYLKLLAYSPSIFLTFKKYSFRIFLKIINYRGSIILNNLRNSFPKKTNSELLKIKNQFYNHLSDLVTENIQLLNTSKLFFKNKFIFKNKELIHSCFKNKKDVIIVLGHYGNWEWGLLASNILSEYEMIGVYKPLNSRFWDKKVKKIRSQFGASLISMKEAARKILKKHDKPRIIALINDQTPAKEEINYWSIFLNQKTPVFLGAEKLSKKLNCPIIFSKINKLNNEKYEVEFELITNTPQEFKEGEITNLFLNKLEKQIISKPEYWLWSHRRWKHNQK